MLSVWFMARKNQLDSCLNNIEFFFDKLNIKSFSKYILTEIIRINKYKWGVPTDKHPYHIIKYILTKKLLSENNFSDSSNKIKIIYSWKINDELTIMSGLKSNSYFSYYTALYLHQLTLQIPKTIYLNFEHSPSSLSPIKNNSLTQESIDSAFNSNQRKSSVFFSYKDKKIILTNGKNTNKLGVIKRINKNQCFEYTDLERTIIDISIRPGYAGGIFEVLEAYKLAKAKLNVPKMADDLTKLNYTYPYHQVIGFYLEKAGYSNSNLKYFKKKIKFDFYLTYNIRIKEYSETWKLYYPKGIL